jgi:hypothetical protein
MSIEMRNYSGASEAADVDGVFAEQPDGDGQSLLYDEATLGARTVCLIGQLGDGITINTPLQCTVRDCPVRLSRSEKILNEEECLSPIFQPIPS